MRPDDLDLNIRQGWCKTENSRTIILHEFKLKIKKRILATEFNNILKRVIEYGQERLKQARLT